jgi:hypothetical protein
MSILYGGREAALAAGILLTHGSSYSLTDNDKKLVDKAVASIRDPQTLTDKQQRKQRATAHKRPRTAGRMTTAERRCSTFNLFH